MRQNHSARVAKVSLLTLKLPSRDPVNKCTVVPIFFATAPVGRGWKTCRAVTVLTKLSNFVRSWPAPRLFQTRTSVPPPLISNAPTQQCVVMETSVNEGRSLLIFKIHHQTQAWYLLQCHAQPSILRKQRVFCW